jgi:ABC-type lipoprotein release transport system permease subunit
MKLLLLLSWKNIWRTRKRSFAVIGSIGVGVWALSFLFAFTNSFNEGYIRNAIQYDYSHVQIHHPRYRLDPVLDNSIQNADAVTAELASAPEVVAFSDRTIVSGMVATGKNNQGVQIVGVDPTREAEVTLLDSTLIEGEYFTGRRNPLLISKKLAAKLAAKIRSKVVLTFQDSTGNITAAAFRVDGIFETKSPRINEGVVYVKKEDIQSLVQLHQIQEIAILLQDAEQIPAVQEKLQDAFPNAEVQSFRELAPEFDLIAQQSTISKQVLTMIIMLALLFGIVNTMLMAVLERTKELGMLRAIGLQKSNVFMLVLLETVLMSAVGGPIGVLLGVLTNGYYGANGMDLSNYSETLKAYGYDSIFYPELDTAQYPILMVVVIVTAFIGAIYPAIKAVKLNPVESIRKI